MKKKVKKILVPPRIESLIIRESKAIMPKAWGLATAIFNRPELAYHEYFASEAIIDFLEEFGFKVERRAGGLKTAFVADKRGRKRPCVAFLAEMDALPELGHACGHHLIAAGSAGAGAVLAKVFPRPAGSIRVIGCPAEEAGGGKVKLAHAGVFAGIDAALLVHPERTTEVYKRSLGMVEVEIKFTGKAAHAAANPEDGINALDAVIQTMNAINAMRQQMPDKTRVHGIITDGGQVPNIIPERASALFLARGLTVDETLETARRVVECARGAALATGTKLKARVLKNKMYAPYVPNRALGEVFSRALERLGIEIDAGQEDEGMGSTDVGNVGLAAPILHPMIALPGVKDGCHTRGFAKAGGEGPGRAMLEKAIPAMALAGAAVLMDPGIRKAIKKDF